MKTIEEFLSHGGPLRALRRERNRWSCLHHDGWHGSKMTIENSLYTFCGTTCAADRALLWRELRQAVGDCGVVVFPVKERGTDGTYRLLINPEPPTVVAYDTGKRFVVDCPYCGARHHHGRGTGHRVSHCASRVRVKLPGYVLQVASTNAGHRRAPAELRTMNTEIASC